MLFANRRIVAGSPSIVDIAPTVLDLLGVPAPPWYDGQSLLPAAMDNGSREAPAPQSGAESALS